MPIYDFLCNTCKATVETFQSFDAPPPLCCGKPMERQIGSIMRIDMGTMSPFMKGMTDPNSKIFQHEKKYRDRRAYG